jgi:hypothetical protein
MALNNDVTKTLVDAGNQLKKDLWRPQDLVLLQARAADLIGLNAKAAATTDASKKEQYKLAAKGVLEHVKLLALLRVQVTQDHLLDALGKFFLTVALPTLVKLLPAVL